MPDSKVLRMGDDCYAPITRTNMKRYFPIPKAIVT